MKTDPLGLLSYTDVKLNADFKKIADNNSELITVARELEAVFLNMVIKSMHDANASFKSEMIDRSREDFFQDILNNEMANAIAKSGGIGIADAIVKQLSHTNQLSDKK